MNVTQHSYRSEADLSAMLALKHLCATPENLSDRPTLSDLRRLFVPFLASAHDQQSQAEALRGMSLEQRYRIATQQLTTLWEDAGGQLVAYALIAQPGCSLTVQIHPQVQGQGLEAEILAWGLTQMQRSAQARGTPGELWCRCHTIEQEWRGVLETAGFSPLFEPDLRMVHPLATPLPSVSLPEGFSLKHGVTSLEFDAYQELHQAVFDGVSINRDEHESSGYQSELDLIAVGPPGQFGAFCQGALKQVMDRQGEHLVGEIGVIGTRPELTHQGLGRALLLTCLRLLQERGATCAYLETSASHVLAQRLFTSVGFRHLSTWQWYAKAVVPA